MENETSPPAPVNPVAAPATYTARPPSRFLFESLLIVLSVVLGFVVTQWRETVAERELAERVLDNVLIELQANLATVTAHMAALDQNLQKLDAALPGIDASPPEESGLEFFFSHLGGNFSGRPLRRAAWDAAVSSGALRLIDYEVAAMLSEIYVTQEDVYEAMLTQTTQIVFAPDIFDPRRKREVAQMLRWLIVEQRGREGAVREAYEKYLPLLEEAAGAGN